MTPNPTGQQQIPLCCLLKTTFLSFPACPWGNPTQVRDHHAAGTLRSQPQAVDGGHGREGAGECSWSCSQLECAAQQCPLLAAAAGDQCCRAPSAPTGCFGFPPCQPLRNEAASLLFCSSLPAGRDILCVPALSHLFKGVTAHPAPMFSHLSVPTGVPFLQSEQSLWFAYITEDFPSNRCPTEMQGGSRNSLIVHIRGSCLIIK